jgi:thiol-disulfide isomerase/thioredoxin
MMNYLKGLSYVLAVSCALGMSAQSVTPPSISTYSNGTIILGITENGKWAIFEARGEVTSEDETSISKVPGGKILDVEKGIYTDVLSSNSSINGNVADITNDGNIVVGVYQDKPAYWNKTTGVWTTLGSKSGSAVAVSADGHYAVGHVMNGSTIYQFTNAMWDLTTGKAVTLNNVPNKDLSGINQGQNQFNNISADGRYILGCVDFSYVEDTAFYVYDRETETYDYIGFDESASGSFTAKISGIHHIETATMSASGKYITGSAYMVKVVTSDNYSEYEVAYRYNCATKEFEIFDGDGDSGIVGYGIDDNGVVYGATPTTSPLRDVYIRNGKYWYNLSQILSQRYGIDFEDRTGFDITGTPTSVSADGLILGTFTDPQNGEGYIMKLSESLYDACASVDLMGNYSVTPASGASFSQLSSLTITFDRNVTVKGSTKDAALVDASGKTVRNSMGLSASGSKVTVQFRPTTLTAGETYSVVIPAGTIAMSTDEALTNREITVKYIGRNNEPVAATSIYPEPESSISKFDYSSSHILLNFDANIEVVDGAEAKIYRNDEAEAYNTLQLATSGSQLALYPISTLYLYKDNSYRVVIPAGSVTDLGGSSANEEITIEYTGNYEREVSSTDKILFSEDFSNGFGTQLMYYEGDNNVPTSEMQGYSFDQSSTPWQLAYDADVVDLAIMSHSSYTPAGTSDDWMVIPSLYIPDENCYLSFDSQGFNRLAKDELHVYVIPVGDNVYNELTTAAINEFKENRILVYNEVQDPGSSEQDLLGDWTTNEINLGDYAGQDIYIAFVNENTDQSIVFVDNIQVIHDMRFSTVLDNETTVVAKDNIDIQGRIVVQSTVASYSSVRIELYDDYAVMIDAVEENGVTIDASNPFSFRFSKPLPLEIGKENIFKLVVSLDEEEYTLSKTITDLAFMPTKRVFLEEYAGSDCGNCPLGILAIEKLNKELPNNFIPVSIRTYNSDALGNGLSSYSYYLGLDNAGAPSAMINRKTICYPMTQDGSKYVFNAPEGSSALWTDVVYEELETPAIAEIEAVATLNEIDKTLNIPFSVTYAIDKINVNNSVLFLVIENNLETYQRNYFYTQDNQPNLGEWQKGGIYGTAEYVYPVYANDVVRSVIGQTFNGTQGYVPSKVTAGVANSNSISVSATERVEDYNNAELVAVLIDNNTDQVINACKSRIVTSGVKDAVVDQSVIIKVDADGNIVATADSQANVEVYDLTGKAIECAKGSKVVAKTNGYKGVAIVKVTTDKGANVQKVVIK